MAESGNSKIVTRKEEPINLFSFLQNFELKVPFFNQEKRTEEFGVKEEPGRAAAGESGIQKPGAAVRFPNNGSGAPPPVKAEAEEGSGRTHNPVVVWQAYAIGGFIVLKWVWARWNERKERAKKTSSSDDNQSRDAPAGEEE